MELGEKIKVCIRSSSPLMRTPLWTLPPKLNLTPTEPHAVFVGRSNAIRECRSYVVARSLTGRRSFLQLSETVIRSSKVCAQACSF